MLRDFIGTTLVLAVTTDTIFTGGKYSVVDGGVPRDSENLLILFETMFCRILQPYSRLDTTNPYPIPDALSVNP